MALVHIILVGLLASGSIGGYYLVEEEYLPVNTEIREPKNSEEIPADKTNESVYLKDLECITKSIPESKGLSFNLFVSEDTISDLKSNYYAELTGDGYEHKADYSGEKKVAMCSNREITFETYQKGATMIVIAMTPIVYSSSYLGQTIVVYTTGSIIAYQRIIDWYNGLDGIKQN